MGYATRQHKHFYNARHDLMNPFQEADLEEAGATDFPFGSPVEVCEYWASTQHVPPDDSQKIEDRHNF